MGSGEMDVSEGNLEKLQRRRDHLLELLLDRVIDREAYRRGHDLLSREISRAKGQDDHRQPTPAPAGPRGDGRWAEASGEPGTSTDPAAAPAGSKAGGPVALGEGALPTKAAAIYIGLSPKTLETLRCRGGGPHFAKLGRRVVYRREDLDAWLAERVQRSTSDAR